MRRHWWALAAASRAEVPRVPFFVGGRRVGSVAVAHLPALRHVAAKGAPGAWRVTDAGVVLDAGAVAAAPRAPAAAVARAAGGRGARTALDDAFAELNAGLRDEGLIRAWRDEPFVLPDPLTLEPLACIERASARFWGTLTLGAHANGLVGAVGGAPQVWVAQRSATKATDPGRFDNLIGGGVPHGQDAKAALVREGHEEAGLGADVMARARPAGVLRLARDCAEGFQHEWLHAFDLPLAAGETPRNLDGEVQGFRLLAAQEALALAREDGAMTVDAALVTLDWAARHGLVADPAALAALAALRVAPVRRG